MTCSTDVIPQVVYIYMMCLQKFSRQIGCMEDSRSAKTGKYILYHSTSQRIVGHRDQMHMHVFFLYNKKLTWPEMIKVNNSSPNWLAKYSLYPFFKCRYSICTGQTFLSLTRYIENILTTFIFLNKFIMNINSTIYLMILIMYYKY
jgi:hypothetical protein